MADRVFLGIAIAATAALLLPLAIVGQNQAVSQEMDSVTLVDTQTIDLRGWINPDDFVLLMDITTFLSEEGHLAMKVPCGSDGEQLLTVLAGVAPEVGPVELDYVAPLSNPPVSCVYHGHIGAGITDIALANTSDQRVRFHGSAGYTVTITIHGEKAEAHI